MSKIQLPSEKETNTYLTVVSGLNNFWSAVNNVNQGSLEEAKRSTELLMSDVASILQDMLKSPVLKKLVAPAGVAFNVHTMIELSDRLKANSDDFKDRLDPNNAKYNNGYVKQSLIMDIFSDVNAIVNSVLNLVGIIPVLKFNPIMVFFNVVSAYATYTSNSMNSHPDWNEEHLIHSSEISDFFIDGAMLTLENWPALIKPLLDALDNFVPEYFKPWITPDPTTFNGDADGKPANDIIDADKLFDDEYDIRGNAGNDTLIGGYKKDLLNGGTDNDILIGNGGNDDMHDEQGYDTYHIKDHDTIYDKDGKGQILFNNQALPKEFIRHLTTNIYYAKDTKGNVLYTAIKNDNDLSITPANSSMDKVIIKDFFKVAKVQENTYSALSIALVNSKEESEKHDSYLIKTDDKLSSDVRVATYPNKYIDIIGSDKTDNIVANQVSKFLDVDTGKGNDLILGGDFNDIVKGGEGNDVISGSMAYYDVEPNGSQKVPKLTDVKYYDSDLLIGNAGNDLIAGGIGDDVIWVDDKYEFDANKLPSGTHPDNPNNVNINGKGDWALGGRGNDTIYGGVNKDFLQGGADSDHIYGGGGNDVILGDGHIRFSYKPEVLNNPIIVGDGINTIGDTFHPYIYGITHNVPNYKKGDPLSVEYMFVNGKPVEKKHPTQTVINPKTFEWDVKIDLEKGDYTLNPHKEMKLSSMYNHHLIAKELTSDNTSDFLYGGAGDDLIVGQYGHDALYGNDGSDILYGDDNRDVSNENIQGNDYLRGGAGFDRLMGGFGYDTYDFKMEDLKTSADNKIIMDSDNKGVIVLDGVSWAGKRWVQDETFHGVYGDGQGNFLIKNGRDYLIQSKNFGATITLRGFAVGLHDELLGMKFLHERENTAPFVHSHISNTTVFAGEEININLANTFLDFGDSEDKLTYSLSGLAGAKGLYFDPDIKSLVGVAPDSGIFNLTLTATDTQGLTGSTNFVLGVHSKTPKTPVNGILLRL